MRKPSFNFFARLWRCVAVTLCTVCVAWPALALDEMLDAGFGTAGKAATAVGGSSVANAVVQQADGKLVVAGSSYNGSNWDVAVLRYNSNGTLDSSFGTGGVVTTAVGSGNDLAYALALQADGKIVVGGTSVSAVTSFDNVVLRYNSDGSLDTSFATGGKQVVVLADDQRINTLKIATDGTIVAVGYDSYYVNGGGTTKPRMQVSRFAANGEPIGATLTLRSVSTDALNVANAMALLSDGGVLLAGYQANSNDDVALVRVTSGGQLDTDFGVAGWNVSPVGSGADRGQAVALSADGKIVVAGYSHNGSNNDIAVLRYNSNGSLDTAFDGDGKLTTAMGSGADQANAVAVQADGKILAAGYSYNGTKNDFALLRYSTNGSLDSTFSGDGMLRTSISLVSDVANAMLVQADGKVVLVGQKNTSIALVRYAIPDNDGDGYTDTIDALPLNNTEHADFDLDGVGDNADLDDDSDGVPDTADNCPHSIGVSADQTDTDGDGLGNVCDFDDDNDGVLNYLDDDDDNDGVPDISDAFPRDPAESSDADHDGTGDVADLDDDNDGVLDISDCFPLKAYLECSGSVETIVSSRAVLNGVVEVDDGKIVVLRGYSLMRFNADRTLDATFGFGGETSVPFVAHELVRLVDGSLVVVGEVNAKFVVSRYLPNGVPDVSFGGDGYVETAVADSANRHVFVLPQAGGKLLLVGTSNYDVAMVRYNQDGSLDSSFGSAGKVFPGLRALFGNSFMSEVSAAVRQRDGAVVLAVRGSVGVTLVRFSPDGVLDSQFVQRHSALVKDSNAFMSGIRLILQSDNKILLVNSYSVVRFTEDGSLDDEFGNGGIVLHQAIGVPNFLFMSAVLQMDGKLVVEGWSATYFPGECRAPDGCSDYYANPVHYVFRLNGNGMLDLQFDGDMIPASPPFEFMYNSIVGAREPSRIVLLNNGHILMLGAMNHWGNTALPAGIVFLSFMLDSDTDMDGYTDVVDLDDDGDGVPDYIDADPLNAANANERTLLLNAPFIGSSVHEATAVQ